MATVENERDVLLQAAATRSTVLPNSQIILPASDGFRVTTGGSASPTSISITATLLNLEGTVTFNAVGCTLTGISGNTATLTYANLAGSSATVTASLTLDGVTITSNTMNIGKTLDGVVGTSVYTGTVYKQQVGTPTTPTGGSFNFGTTTLTAPSGWTVTQPTSTTTPTWVAEYTFSTNTAGATVAGGTWTAPVVDAANGLDGSAVYTLEVYQQVGSAPSAPTAGSGTYNFSTDTFSNTGMTAWSRALPTSSTTPTYRSAYTFSTTTPSVTVAGGTWSTPVVVAQNGATGAAGLNNAIIKAYQRSATMLTSNPGIVDYDFTSKTITTATLANGWSKTIPAGSNPLYETAATASSNTSTDNILAAEWSTPVIITQDGATGANTATVFIYQRTNSSTPPSLPSATTTFTFATGALTGLNNGWSVTFPTSNLTGQFVHVSTATASSTTSTDTILSSEWAAAKILAQNGASINNIVPDPTFRDLAFWGRNIAGSSVSDFTAGSTTWKTGYALAIQETANTLVTTSSQLFAMTPGATYRVEIQVFLSTDFVGSFSPFWYVPGDSYQTMGCPSVGSNWGDGLQISFNTSSTKNVISTFTSTYTVPSNGYTFQTQILLRSQMSAGTIQVGSISIVRMSDTNLIPSGVTLTNPVIVSSFAVAALSDLSGSGGTAGVITSRSYGTRTAVPSGGVSPYTYNWTVSQSAGTYPITSTGNTTATITLGGKGKDESNEATVSVTVTDANKLTITRSFYLSEVHGTPP